MLRSLLCLALSASASAQSLDLVWEAQDAISPAFDSGRVVVPTDDGGYYVLSIGTIGGVPQPFLGRHDASTAQLWRIDFGRPTTIFALTDMCPDGAGGVFVSGYVRGAGFADPPLGGVDGMLIRIDDAGTIVWSRRLGAAGREFAYGVQEDGAGGVFVVGFTESDASFGGAAGAFSDAFAARYDSTGFELWVAREPTSTHYDSFDDAVPDGAGGILCCGGAGEDPGFVQHGLMARIDATGTVVWSDRSLADVDYRGAAEDGSGGLVATGTNYATGRGVLTRRDAGGALLWTTALVPAQPAGATAFADAVERLPDGTFVVVGNAENTAGQSHQDTRFVQRFDGAGMLLEEVLIGPSTTERSLLRDIELDGRGSAFLTGFVGAGAGVNDTWTARWSLAALGVAQCAGQPNSTGAAAEARAAGSALRVENAVTLYTVDLPRNSAAYFLGSPMTGFVPGAGGSQGDLCLGGSIGRFNRPGEVLDAGADGRFHLLIDLDDVPTPTGSTSVLAGQPWFFQAWYRDANPGATSNFSGSVRVVLQ
ncbi:MAG: hypothetical protein AAGI22_17000 [Planctomycetota bacterium]